MRLAHWSNMRILDLTAVLSLALFSAACPGEKGDGGEETGSSEATDSEADPTTTAEPDTQVTNASEMTETSETSATETDTSDTDPPPAACECGGDDPCSQQLCDQVRWVDDDGDGELDADAVDAYTASSQCALEALRDGVAGRLAWESYSNGGQFNEHGVLKMFGDRTAVLTLGGVEDICFYEVEREVVGPLQSASAFEKCLADLDLDARFGCVRNAGAGEATVCVEGEMDCSGV
jgi:hypothetical protein